MAGLLAVLALATALAFANGSNDVSKGIATLVGSGVTSFRRAVAWGTVWTVAGGLVAAFAAQGLVATFSGRGFLDRPAPGPAFLASVATGAAAWVLFASRTGLPVSTTHAIAGALAGAGIVAEGAAMLHWGVFGWKVALPLALSPVLSIALVTAIFPFLSRPLARAESYCLCLERRSVIVAGEGLALESSAPAAVVASERDCATSRSVAARFNLVDGLHWLSSACTSFARGLNDTPKIVALGIAAAAGLGLSGGQFYLTIAVGMGLGSLIGGLRVTSTLAARVTRMSPSEGFAANAVTTLLVSLASWAALPVSTTQVSSGAIIGIGLRRGAREVGWGTVRDLLIAWMVTVPVAGLVGAGAFALFGRWPRPM